LIGKIVNEIYNGKIFSGVRKPLSNGYEFVLTFASMDASTRIIIDQLIIVLPKEPRLVQLCQLLHPFLPNALP